VQQVSDICESIAQQLGGCRNVYMTGGFSLNCPSNSDISHASPTLNYRPLPGVGDTGLPLGAAVALHYFFRQPMAFNDARDPMAPAFPPSALDHRAGRDAATPLERIEDPAGDMAAFLAERLIEGQVICVHRGRSEVGPRALGHRSIIAWAGIEATRDRINALKGREDWRPLAPIVAVEDFHDYFVGDPEDCRFMLAVSKVKTRDIPAITHVDNTARVQVIDAGEAFLYPILRALKARGVAPVIVNTSFNCAGEPLVETFEHAARSFAKMGFELLVSEGELYRATGAAQARPVPAAEGRPAGIRAA
jgi:carbamoyltransferase